jgi:hypothetical protein
VIVDAGPHDASINSPPSGVQSGAVDPQARCRAYSSIRVIGRRQAHPPIALRF